MKIDWHSRPASDHQKDVVLERFRRYLKNIGLHDETIKLYLGRVRSFLDFANSHDPDVAIADRYLASMPLSDQSIPWRGTVLTPDNLPLEPLREYDDQIHSFHHHC